MSMSTTATNADIAEEGAALKARPRKAKRTAQLHALLLIAPLMLFLTLIFLLPIGVLFTQAIDNGNGARILPNTSAALIAWDGKSAPDETMFEALAGDLKEAPRETVAELAKQLNYYDAGMRSMFIKTARELRKGSPPYRDVFVAVEPQWATERYWLVLRQVMPSTTDFYLLSSLDLARDGNGDIARVAPENAIHADILVRTFVVSASVTLLCLLLGYPLAALIARSKGVVANILLIFVLLPFWTSLLVRTSAWVVLLQSRGVVNSLFAWLGFIDANAPPELIYNRVGVLIAMTHILLPFMVLPIYSVMKGIPPVYMRAAASLGAHPLSAFWNVYLPMSMPGVSAGSLLVFILALGYYITPALVGGPRDQMISYFIAYYANQVTNWGMAAALSIILLVAVIILYAIYNRFVGIDRLRIG